MKMQTAIPAAVLALSLAAGGAVAKDKRHKQPRQDRAAAAAGLSVSGADANGAVAGGLSASGVTTSSQGRDRNSRRQPDVNAAQTNSSGAIYTTRRSAAAAVNTNGSAAGTGAVSSGSTVDAYGETNRNGSNADIYGDSAANAGD